MNAGVAHNADAIRFGYTAAHRSRMGQMNRVAPDATWMPPETPVTG